MLMALECLEGRKSPLLRCHPNNAQQDLECPSLLLGQSC